MIKVAKIVKSDQRTVRHQLGGNTVEPLSPSSENAYGVLIGTIPTDAGAPLHSHSDSESFYLLSGEAEALVQTADGLEWQTLKPGDFVHTPGGVKHAWRNRSSETAIALVISTAEHGRALVEMGRNAGEHGFRSPSAEALQRIVEVGERHGYWYGSPEENAAVGIELA
jgi:quercetin dioxygenase-like cupin family protein